MTSGYRNLQKNFSEFVVSNDDFEVNEEVEQPLKPSKDRFRKVELVRKVKKDGVDDDNDYVRIELSSTGQYFGNQIDILAHTDYHPAIVQFEGFGYYPEHFAITRYYPNGSLQHMLKKKKKPSHWTGTMKSITVFGLVSAVAHIHNLHDDGNDDFSIRYLCPENIIFDSENHPRLIHYFYGNEKLGKSKNAYIPPELHRNPNGERYNEDVWALGMILYEILTGHEPYKGQDEDEIKELVKSGELPELPEESEETNHIIGIIQNCLDKNPKNRPLPYMIYHHLNTTTDPLFPETNQVTYDNYRNKVSELTADSKEFKSYRDFIEDAKPSKDDIFEKAKSGDLYSLVLAGRYYQKGLNGTKQDPEKGFKYYMKAAKKNYPIGLYNASVCLMKGIGCEEDPEESFKLMKKAADLDLERAVSIYGLMLKEGNGTKQNLKKAIDVFKKGAEKNYGDCLYELGCLYYEGCSEFKKDTKKALQYYTSAASLGLSKANNDIAYHYYQKGVEKDDDESIQKAIKLYKKAANQKSTNSLINLGIIYQKGNYVDKDEAQAAKYFKKAADLGDTQGMVRYGICLKNGTGVDKSSKEAKKMFKKAADNDDKTGMHQYAKMLYDDDDIEEAAKYFKMAADRNAFQSAFYYAKILIKGEGDMDKDLKKGKKYLEKYKSKVDEEKWLPGTKELTKLVK